jgi:hypothetical protein
MFLDSRFLPKCILDRFHSGRNVLNKKLVILHINDKKILDDDGKQHLFFILTKRKKRQESLQKLYRYIKAKLNEGIRCHVNSEVLEKLELVETRLKNLHEVSEIMKVKLH